MARATLTKKDIPLMAGVLIFTIVMILSAELEWIWVERATFSVLAIVMILLGGVKLYLLYGVLKSKNDVVILPDEDKSYKRGGWVFYLAIFHAILFGAVLPCAGLFIIYDVWDIGASTP